MTTDYNESAEQPCAPYSQILTAVKAVEAGAKTITLTNRNLAVDLAVDLNDIGFNARVEGCQVFIA